MKKLITMIAVCMMAYVLPAAAETSSGSVGTGAAEVKSKAERLTPEQRIAKIDERIKKLEEHKAKASSNGKADIANAVQGLIDALNNLKGVIGSQNKESIKGAAEQVKTARAALKELVPQKAKGSCSKAGGNNEKKTQGKSGL